MDLTPELETSILQGDNGNWECKCNLTGTAGKYTGLWQKTHGGGGSSSKCTLFEAGHRVVGFATWYFVHCYSHLVALYTTVLNVICNS